MKKFAIILVGLIFAGGCATDNVISSGQNATVFNGTADTTRLPHGNKIYLTEDHISETKGYKVLGEISVSNLSEGEEAKIFQKIANKALEVGADALFEVSVWRQPTGGAWAAPQGLGTAIKLDDDSKVDLTRYKGKWWNAYIVKNKPPQKDDAMGQDIGG